MTGPAIGEPDPGRGAPPRAGFGDAGGILVLLALGLTFRLIIAYLLPGSGFKVDIESFVFWAGDLARNGLYGFYERPFFHDYTPGYLYVLWLVGGVGNLFGGGVGDLIKVPPVLADVALAYLVWSMTRELGGSERAARLGAIIVLVNPVTWFDSVVWGQVDSVGVVFLLLALRELWRDRPERAALLATVAALIKPQLGILIPLVAIVVIRRALWPAGGYGAEDPPARLASTTSWEERVRGPIRIFTTAGVGVLTAILLSLPFGLSLTGLVAQIFKTAAGYPYLSVNAFNPWALVTQTNADGRQEGIAASRSWVCDSTIVASPASEFRIGPFVIPEFSTPATTTDKCPDGLMIGAFPAVLVGALLFLVVAGLVLWLVARRPDRMTMVVGLAVLAIAFFVLPTRVHERYLFPFVAIAAIPAAFSVRWRLAYLLSAAATFSNMYVILTTYYTNNPRITDWLGFGDTLASFWGVAIAAVTQAAVLAWVFFQLREEATEGLAEDAALAGRDPGERTRLSRWLGRPALDAEPDLDAPLPGGAPPATAPGDGDGRWARPEVERPLPRWAYPMGAARAELRLAGAGAGAGAGGGGSGGGGAADVVLEPNWDEQRDEGIGPLAWVRARLGDSPIRADRSRELDTERGGRLDKLDLWFLAVLAISLMTVRMWRLSEPYQMHFDEVYHPRTATEFLQDWRYGTDPPEIYEWTHPHMAKYAMAFGLVAFGEDKVAARSQLDVPVVAAVIEPRRDDGLDSTKVQGDRVWVATGSEVRAYDLGSRRLAATIELPGAVALAYDDETDDLYVGTRSGEIQVLNTLDLDLTRRGPPILAQSHAFMDLQRAVRLLYMSSDGSRLAAVLEPADGNPASLTSLVVIDPAAASEIARTGLRGVTQITDSGEGRLIVATSDGVAFIDPVTGGLTQLLGLGGPAMGAVRISDIENDPIYVPMLKPDGPKVAVVVKKGTERARINRTLPLPGTTAGRAYWDLAARMVHIEGNVAKEVGGLGPSAAAGTPTVYVIEPHGNAIYADSPLPYVPAAVVMDDNQRYPSTDRQQLLAFSESGEVASVAVGQHAYAWRVPGVVAGMLMALLLYVLARLLFRRRTVAVLLGLIVLVDGMLFAQSRIGMNDSYVGLGIIGAYVIFTALWLHPGNSRRHWLAFAIGIPIIGVFLGFALASKWVAAYAIGGLGILTLARSALGRLILLAGLVVMTTVLGYVAISVAEGSTGGNYVFLLVMIALVIIGVLANVLHPIAWTMEEVWFAVGFPAVLGVLALLYGLRRGDITADLTLGPVTVSPLELGLLGFIGAGVVYLGFIVLGRLGFGPLVARDPEDPTAILEPAAEAPKGWLRLGSGFGLPAVWLVVGLLVIPLALYVVSYLPWAYTHDHQIVAGFPAGHKGQTLLELTDQMYRYHNNLSSAHPASSPWWAWTLDLKPVWFYEEGFAGNTSASIYDAGNLVAWWLAIPALAFTCWQAFRRRSPALALVAIGFAVQWISWARIDRAAFQYHYYTSLPFLFIALAYFLAELWHGPSRRTWLLARLSAAAAVLGPFTLWLLHRPLCAVARVTDVNPGSQACPTLIPDVTITVRAVAIAVVVGLGVLLLLRELLSLPEEDVGAAGEGRNRWLRVAFIAAGTSIAFVLVSTLLNDFDSAQLTNIPVEPIAAVVTIALLPAAGYVATARDSRRFVLGAVGAMAFWFILWYPNIAALPLPSAMHNAYQGFLPTYLFPFQFWVLEGDRPRAPALFALGPAVMLLSVTFMAIVIGYSAWSWRVALAERRRDRLAELAARATVEDGRELAPAE